MRARLNAALRACAEKDGRGYPDWATRYLPVARGLARYGLEGKRILEIGANDNGLSRFTGMPVVAVDIALSHLKAARAAQDVTPCAGSMDALPFPDDVFDAVVCMDSFEHVSEPLRVDAASEMLRVLRPEGVAVCAFPSGEAALAAEQSVQTAYEALTGARIDWLEEHHAMGLPDGDAVAGLFRSAAADRRLVRVEKNASLWAWTWMWRVLMCGWPGRGNGIAQVVLRWLTPLLARCHGGACYRAVVWVAPEKGGS
jgi:SAM-dependent methyltransferase